MLPAELTVSLTPRLPVVAAMPGRSITRAEINCSAAQSSRAGGEHGGQPAPPRPQAGPDAAAQQRQQQQSGAAALEQQAAAPWALSNYYTKKLSRETDSLGNIMSSPDTIAAAPGWTPDAQLRLAAEALAAELQQDAGALLKNVRCSANMHVLSSRLPQGSACISTITALHDAVLCCPGLAPPPLVCPSLAHPVVFHCPAQHMAKILLCTPPFGLHKVSCTIGNERWLPGPSISRLTCPPGTTSLASLQVHRLHALLPGMDSMLRRMKPAELICMAAQLEQVCV